MSHKEMHHVRLPRDAKVWLDVGECVQEEAKAAAHVILRAKNGIRIEVAKSDLAEVNGKMLLCNGAEIHKFRDLNPSIKLADSCRVFDYPNSCYMKDTSCAVLVLICHYCCYDENGSFEKEKSEACGVCIGG